MSAYYNEIEPYAAQWLRNLIAKGLIADGEVDTRSIVDVAPDDLRAFTQCHFFAGIGGWSHALRLAGWPDDRPVWTGSCPCQPFSVAGKGAGTDDARHLWPHFHRLIAACRPPVVMGEQVAGKAGYGWFDGVRSDLEGIGYAGRAVDIPALAVNAPHIRQRLYWVAVDLADTGYMRRGDRPKSGEQELSPSSGLGSPTVALVNPAGEGLEGHGQSGRVAKSGVRKASIVVSGEGCGPVHMADADQSGRGRRPCDGDGERHGQAGERVEDHRQPAGGGEDRLDVADASNQRRERDAGKLGEPQPLHERKKPIIGGSSQETFDSRSGSFSHMADANISAVRGRRGEFPEKEGAEARRSDNGSGCVGSFWDDHIWLTGSDGKSRRSKSGLPLLVNGVSNCLANVLSICEVASKRITDHAKRSQTDPGEVLRMVREHLYEGAVGEKQPTGMCGELYAPQVLLDFMLSQATACNGATDSSSIKKAGKETVAGAMRIMRMDGGFVHSSCQRQSNGQQRIQSSDPLHELSFLLACDTQAFGEAVFDAHAAINRVGMLRAYGNAIVPPLAAEVIKAFMECEP